ncbi:MAG: hypothetical protein ABIN67_01600 [Ferruginibacter sp.]
MPLQRFDTPGLTNDLPDNLKEKWSQLMLKWIIKERQNLPQAYRDFFFNELEHPEAENGTVLPITWEGFPRHWVLKYPNDVHMRWQASEKLYSSQGLPIRYQDEYLEWLSFKKNGKLDKVVFTCEGPEYWQFIAENDENILLSLYQQYVDPSIQKIDLFTGSGVARKYNPYNKWNTTDGIMHLIQPNNTLRAEINLAAGATVIRKKDNVNPVTNTHDLICCSGFGAEERFSDPTIGAAVNSLVRQGLSVTLNNPIGLYINKIKTAGIEVPQGYQVKDFWKVIRGNKEKGIILRAEFSAPSNSNINLEDVIVGGETLTYGAQLAEMVEMVIYGKAFKLVNNVPESEECENYCNQVTVLSADKNFAAINKEFGGSNQNDIGLRMIKYDFEDEN